MAFFTKATLLNVLGKSAIVSLCFGPLLAAAQTIASFTPAVGSGPYSTTTNGVTTHTPGTTITIIGTGLANTKSVLLNGTTLTLGTVTSTTVTVTVPVAASTGRLVLTTVTSGVCSAVVSATQFGVARSSSGTTFTQVTAKGSSFNNIRVAVATNSSVVASYGSSVYYSTPTVADLTNTGRADLLIGNANGNVEYWKQSAVRGGTYTKIGNLQVGGTDIRVTNFAKLRVSDIDGDGLQDMLVGTGDGRRIARFEQTAVGATTFNSLGNLQVCTKNQDGTYTTPTELVTSDYYPRPGIADLDNNGQLDMLIGDYSGRIRYYEAKTVGSAIFVDKGNVWADGAELKADPGTAPDGSGHGTGTAKSLLFDMDGNGLIDLVVGTQLGALLRYEQSARNSMTFTSKGALMTAASPSAAIHMGSEGNNEGGFAAPIITDYDGDGLLDIFVGNQRGTVYLYTQKQQAALAASPLPVQLTAFSGQALSTGNQLAWTTATEQNSARFAVERSTDGATYAEVGSVAAAGNSLTAHRYQYLDATAPAGTSYYRLHQLDQDGTGTYSQVVVLQQAGRTSTAQPLAYPTTFTTELHLALPGADVAQAATVTLLTTEGQVVYSATLQLGATPQALADLPALAPGLYLLRTSTAGGATTQRLVRD